MQLKIATNEAAHETPKGIDRREDGKLLLSLNLLFCDVLCDLKRLKTQWRLQEN